MSCKRAERAGVKADAESSLARFAAGDGDGYEVPYVALCAVAS